MAIREEDADTPVMLDAGWFAAADAFGYWPAPVEDQRVLYSVHMYEPYLVTSAPNMTRKQPIAYPGPAPFAGQTQQWDGQRVAQYLHQPLDWAEAMKVPARAWWWVSSVACAGCRAAGNTGRRAQRAGSPPVALGLLQLP